jgi:hypothetical protein
MEMVLYRRSGLKALDCYLKKNLMGKVMIERGEPLK